MTALLRVLVPGLLTLTLGACLACEVRDEGEPVVIQNQPESNPSPALEQGQRVTVDGVVRRVGSDPFSQIVVTDEHDHDWYIVDGGELLIGLEHQKVQVRGILQLRKLVLADGRELGDRRELVETEIVQVYEE